MSDTTRILVTGGSGFIAGHCILQLLDAGHDVRATIRSLDKEAAVRAVLTDSGMTAGDRLEFVAADLTADDGWAAATADVDVVLHVASPVMPGHVEDEATVIEPAVEGTVRVLRAASDAGVRRVVLTSAFHAVSWGHPHTDHVFTEDDWTVLDGPGVDAYGKSKTLAERAAWDLVAGADAAGTPELVTMLPVAVMGPAMGSSVSGANHILQSMLNGSMPATPQLFIPIVDVRDVAAAHVAAIDVPEAAGKRFLLSNGPALEMAEIAATLRERLGEAATKVPKHSMPNAAVRAAARFRPEFRASVPDLGYAKRTSNERARTVLGWTPRDPKDAITAAAESMVARGLVG
ncbi:nucleoside-diphosphate-sugar epimerase [Curtobacterium sp. PhB130]|uniref:SDR family oxidoreductase n=1 Tax=Curtobacterium sp. PhB130 TaxID=2485178 RepID=UPI000F4C2944|nr:aldehyde reductase [Curtobacterium sp. PhB130]ROS75641.1 nucleoside-diphosphate-sugar epimerase [Curtobacterium sp. PhB130]